jgi:hypothetical protein
MMFYFIFKHISINQNKEDQRVLSKSNIFMYPKIKTQLIFLGCTSLWPFSVCGTFW